MSKFISFMTEASLGGRKEGVLNWDHYVIPALETEPNKEYSFWDNKAGHNMKLYDTEDLSSYIDFSTKPNLKFKIVSPDLFIKGNQKYAYVKMTTGETGLVNIHSILKETDSKNTKLFTPDKLLLGGKEYNSLAQLSEDVVNQIKRVYGGSEYKDVMDILINITNTIAGTMNEDKVARFKDTIKYSGFVSNPEYDKVISKNFGEVIAALYIMKTNKKVVTVGFPASAKEPLYDFYGIQKNGNKILYSVKSGGGSSTALANMNIVLSNMSKDNTIHKDKRHQIETIVSLMNVDGRNTSSNIRSFFKNVFKKRYTDIVYHMKNIYPIFNLDDDKKLDEWLKHAREMSESDFVEFFDELYKIGLTYGGKVSRPQKDTIIDLYRGKKNFKHGYLIYPMGSLIIKYLNDHEQYVLALNSILNMASFVSQVSVNVTGATITIEIIPFDKNKFRFSYNSMTKSPNNRPIGFKES